MTVYRKSTLAAPGSDYLEYEIEAIGQPQSNGWREIQFKDKNYFNYLRLRKDDGTVEVLFPESKNRWQHIYASKGQSGGTRKNKRATRKNKRPTRRGRRRASCI